MERSRDERGRFVGDDPSTPENEAYKMSEETKSDQEVVEENNANCKSVLKSKGMWGSALAIVSTAIMVWCDANGIQLSAVTQSLLQGLAMCSGGLAMYGRAKASGPIAVFPKQ